MELRRILAAVAAVPLLALSSLVHATWLDLADGSYAVTLNCTFSSVIPCPGLISGTITVDGSGLSDMDFIVDGQTFSADPADGTFANSLSDFEYSQIADTPFSFLSIRNNLSIQFGPGDHWWVYCNNSGSGSCTPNTVGTWAATPLSSVPEPASLALLAVALTMLACLRGRNAYRCGRPQGRPIRLWRT